MADNSKRRAELEAELAALDDSDDDSDQVTIAHQDGRSFTGTWRRAQQVAASWGFPLLPAPDPEPEDTPKDTPVKRFAGRRIS